LVFNSYKMLGGEGEKVLEMGGIDGCAILLIYA
jgi:hypothetical protein